MGVHWKIWFLGWGGGAWMFLFREGGAWIFLGGWGDELPKKGGAWIVCRFNRGLGKRRGYEFEVGEGWDPNAHYESEKPSYWHKYPKQITFNTVLLLIILTLIDK